jgi:hypothetical protein
VSIFFRISGSLCQAEAAKAPAEMFFVWQPINISTS